MPSAIQVEQQTNQFVLTSDRLQLQLSRRNDRWHLALFARVDAAGPWQEFLSSVEGTAEDSVPPSPALQDCFLQEIEPGTQELQLLGQAGRNVYSAAIRFVGNHDEIHFDCCLRTPVSEGVPSVLATYALPQMASTSARLASGQGVCRIPVLPALTGELEVEGMTDSGTSAELLQLDDIGRILQILGGSATEVTANSARRSLRWRYRLRLLASA